MLLGWPGAENTYESDAVKLGGSSFLDGTDAYAGKLHPFYRSEFIGVRIHFAVSRLILIKLFA